MKADIDQVMRVLDHRGIIVRLLDGKLVGRARQGEIPTDMVRLIRHFKERIIAELLEREVLQETATNILALTPEERARYRAELRGAPPDDPHLAHDRRAYRLATTWLAERSDAA